MSPMDVNKTNSYCNPPFQEGASEKENLVRRQESMIELTKEQADNLRRAAEYLTVQMRLTPHPTERSRIRAMADTADYVAERIDAMLSAAPAEQAPPRTPIGELFRRLPLGYHR